MHIEDDEIGPHTIGIGNEAFRKPSGDGPHVGLEAAEFDAAICQVLRCGRIANNADHMGRRCDLQEVGDDKPTQLSGCAGYDDSFRNCHVLSTDPTAGPNMVICIFFFD